MAESTKSSQTTPPSTPGRSEIGPLEAAIALMGIATVVVLAGVSMWFYGSGGEASTVAVLGASLGTIGSIVGAVVGVGMGTKSGSATGAAASSAADAKTKLAKSAALRAHDALTKFQKVSAPRAEAAAAPAEKPPTADELNRQLSDALTQVSAALEDLR